MKKILLTLLLMLISISSYSQKITKFTFGYNGNDELVCNLRVANYYNKTIVCVIIEMQFANTVWDKWAMRPVYPLVSYKLRNAKILPSNYQECEFYPDNCYGKPTKVKIKKVIFKDRTYIEY